MHGWGSVIGCSYAADHPENIKALAFYESHIRPIESPDMLSLPVQELVYLMRDEAQSYEKIVEENYLVERLLPDAMVTELTEAEMSVYRQPFREARDRKVLHQYLKSCQLGCKKVR